MPAMPAEPPSETAARRADLLASIPLFAVLDAGELTRLAALATEVPYRTGDVVCRRGDEGTTMFVVLGGELQVQGGHDGEQVINRLGPGEIVGEMSMLLGGTRSATVRVARSARLLVFDRAAFEQVLLPNPKVLEYLSRLLCRRLATLARGEVAARTTTVLAVTGAPGLRGRSLVAVAVAALLSDATGRDAVLVRGAPRAAASLAALCEAPGEDVRRAVRRDDGGVASLRARVTADSGGAAGAHALASLVAKLGERFPFVVFDLGNGAGDAAAAAVEVADVVIDVVETAGASSHAPDPTGQRRFEVVNLHNRSSRPAPVNQSDPFVVPDDPALRDLDPDAQVRWVLAHPWSPASSPLHRLARRILGTSLGVAMGGGGAFGIANVGVLAVLEEHGIPIDLVAGSSMGSIIAGGFAAGIRPPEMIDIARRIGTRLVTASVMADLTLTLPSILSGRRVTTIFSPLLGEVSRFEQLRRPCRIVAADIETGERIAIGDGDLMTAMRASAAVPMLWPPVRLEGRTLVDGGIVDPVPAEVARAMGADLCIAVNVVPQLRRGIETVLSRLYRQVNRLNPLAYFRSGGEVLPGMFDLVMNSMQTLQHELGNFKAISADVRINPDLSGYTWIEFYRALELIERGAEAAERALPEIRRVLAERHARSAGS